jgi:hypothetical protein
LALPFILVVCLVGVFCLLPLTLYLLWLARLTRRDRPTAVSGPWDFAGVLLGLSGFILFGGGLLLSLLQSNFRFWMRGNFEALRAVWIQERVTWMLLATFYFVVVGFVAWLTLLARRRSLVVYNVEPVAFEAALVEVFEQLGRPVERRGKLWVSGTIPLFELDTFERGRSVTLRWVSEDKRLFEEADRQLRAAVSTMTTDENPASRWIVSAATGSGIFVVFSFGLLMYLLYLVGLFR